MTMGWMPNGPEKIKQTEYLVEATSNEVLDIWRTYCDTSFHPHEGMKKYSWEQMNPGWAPTIGQLDGRPVRISMFWNRLDGHMIGFWEATSQVVDYRMIDEWFARTFQGVPTVNECMNFSNVLSHLQRK